MRLRLWRVSEDGACFEDELTGSCRTGDRAAGVTAGADVSVSGGGGKGKSGADNVQVPNEGPCGAWRDWGNCGGGARGEGDVAEGEEPEGGDGGECSRRS